MLVRPILILDARAADSPKARIVILRSHDIDRAFYRAESWPVGALILFYLAVFVAVLVFPFVLRSDYAAPFAVMGALAPPIFSFTWFRARYRASLLAIAQEVAGSTSPSTDREFLADLRHQMDTA